MSFVLSVIGFLLLVISLAGVALGLYMAADRRTRRRGRLFAHPLEYQRWPRPAASLCTTS